jgi:hypothetical protein
VAKSEKLPKFQALGKAPKVPDKMSQRFKKLEGKSLKVKYKQSVVTLQKVKESVHMNTALRLEGK